MIFSYLNINSVGNKMVSFREVVMKNVDILAIAETKIHESFPTAQFGSGGILVYVKSSIPSRQLNFPNLYKLSHSS